MKTTPAVTTKNKTSNDNNLRMKKGLPSTSREIHCCWKSPRLAGITATIPAMMIREIPFPIPFSVIFSPSHIKKSVPAVKTRTCNRPMPNPPEERATPPPLFALETQNTTNSAWMRQRPTAAYLVQRAMTFRPDSPSFWSSSSLGNTLVIREKMIDALM